MRILSCARHSKSPNAPSVVITRPVPNAVITDTLTIEWAATDADGDDLLVEVLYSKDGATWQPLLVNSVVSSLSVATGQLASSQAGLVRVRVSDGFETTITDVGVSSLHRIVPRKRAFGSLRMERSTMMARTSCSWVHQTMWRTEPFLSRPWLGIVH